MEFKTQVTLLFVVYISGALATDYDENEGEIGNKAAVLSCDTCQFTIKELDRWLRATGRKGHYSLEAAVSKSLDALCKKDSTGDETSMLEDSDKLISCKDLLARHRPVIKEALIEHYESVEPISYLQLIQDVCHEKLKLCHPNQQDGHLTDNESIMKLNSKNNEMEITLTGSVRTLEPVEENQ